MNRPTALPLWLTEGSRVRVTIGNAKPRTMTVVHQGAAIVTVAGPRGGQIALVENVNGLGVFASNDRDLGRVEALEAL